ncbi:MULTISPECIES: hypothetical protein [unclassified Mesorhizobium]|uniref:hypothetical protein n=1 Tax=unclassified Mesorhizobium TaxID=325217 RepID=UPI001126FD23|nr:MULTISPECIES: hypothetical protein [unclassified Mesorhizobium]MBZ9699877.1 hypothetical protein [Mesorhizobium sp. CO1-1-3]MBZ9946294.1 hypothetical protein [Mesorhizobium sp. BR1-1-11]MBZ9984113.1 hypothetical protein [Mesorhizobium sp. BR-1-1-8]TPJ05463.1 hypothetical protein FJ428_12260 [Mesorhizobium sp. B2-8-1]TPL27328.1 hypothetical protein FJ947_29355 [Mesorhizobium sp. B2-4-8]
MAKQNDPDLFGNTDPQGDLFGAVPVQPTWQPDPEKVRRRLERILAEARAAESMPWDWSKQSLYRTIFPQMAGLLPSEEAAQYCFQFEQEWERLKAA